MSEYLHLFSIPFDDNLEAVLLQNRGIRSRVRLTLRLVELFFAPQTPA
jgi:hypothetical protein